MGRWLHLLATVSSERELWLDCDCYNKAEIPTAVIGVALALYRLGETNTTHCSTRYMGSQSESCERKHSYEYWPSKTA